MLYLETKAKKELNDIRNQQMLTFIGITTAQEDIFNALISG